jgi:peptidoglycan glycosyltransferase
MNAQIRKLGAALLVLYVALFVQLNVVQVLRADDYNNNPKNNRAVTRDYSRPRGDIVSADGTVLATSVPVEGPFERQRTYPPETAELFAHVTGYFSFTAGADGVEEAYNDELAGRAEATSISSFADLLLDEERQADVRLTIPLDVQRVAREQLGDRRGSVVAIDPRDGAILALWSFPSYDPNPLSSVDQELAQNSRALLLEAEGNPLRPKPYRETYFPGSTFKVVTTTAAYASGVATPAEPVLPPESEFVPPQTTQPIRNFGGGTCGGNVVDLLRVSCNTGFAALGVLMGAEPLVETAEAFGFNSRPPLDLPGPVASPIEQPEFFEQNIPVLAQTALGQNAVRASPLEMALVAAGIANGGEIMKPHVLSEVRDQDGEVLSRYEPEQWLRATTPEVARQVRDAMVVVATEGTATRLQVPGVPTAGKTGTAQIGNGLSHAWIIGFAPADNPRVAVAVIVEGQQGASEQTGGRVAAPIGQAVLAAALAATD